MFISVISKKGTTAQIRKTVIVYFLLAAAAIAVDNIYALFGHGVRSLSMSLMFLYPLLGGALFYSVLGLIIPRINEYEHYRLFYNIYNSGIAILTVGNLLKGILYIAGTASVYVPLFTIIGWICVGAAIVLLIWGYGKNSL